MKQELRWTSKQINPDRVQFMFSWEIYAQLVQISTSQYKGMTVETVREHLSV